MAALASLVVQVFAVGQDGVGGNQQLLAQKRLPGAVPQGAIATRGEFNHGSAPLRVR